MKRLLAFIAIAMTFTSASSYPKLENRYPKADPLPKDGSQWKIPNTRPNQTDPPPKNGGQW